MMNVIRFRRRRRRRVPSKLLAGLAVAAFVVALGDQIAPLPQVQTQTASSEKPQGLNGGGAWNGSGHRAWKGTLASSAGAMLVDRVTRVRDGDTIVVGRTPVRIANLDCAEKGTAAGQRATRKAKDLVAQQTVQCRLEGRRSYDREVGVCALQDGQDFGQLMVAQGVCSRWRG